MQVLVVSGFLGAGKTTFIQELSRRTGRDFVVYENEYGQADVDAQRLRSDAELDVWESTENCICCTGKQDFASSVLTISNVLDPEFLVVEPTGVARLSSIRDNILQIGYERISLLPSICIVDAHAWQEQRTAHQDIFDDQVASAATIVVAKLSDGKTTGNPMESDPGLAQLLALVGSLNPQATVTYQPYAQIPDEWWSELLSQPTTTQATSPASTLYPGAGDQSAGKASNTDEPGLETLSLAHSELPSPTHLIWVLDALSAGVFGHIERAKGTLSCGNQWVRFDMVGRTWAITGSKPVKDAACVFIGLGLKRMWLREVFVPALWRSGAEIQAPQPSRTSQYHTSLRPAHTRTSL